MKTIILLSSAIAFLLCSCSVEDREQAPSKGDEVVLSVNADNATKASAVTSVPSTLWVSMTSGNAGSGEATYLSPAQFSVSGGKVPTGVYQSSVPVAYNIYASNSTLSYHSDGATVDASNTTDVVAGMCTSSDTAPSITLSHIFARTGGISIKSSVSGYTVSNISAKIKSYGANTGTAGTYNLVKGTWSDVSSLSSTSLTGSSDMYLVPGTYTVLLTYTLTKGSFSETYSNVQGTVVLTAGKVNEITGTVSNDDATPISLGVSLKSWDSGTASISWD